MGAGAALVMPATLSILTGVFTDPAERAKAIGIWSAVSGLGVAVGPTLGGLLLERFALEPIFLINIPVVIVALIAGRRLIPASRAKQPPRIDLTGATLSVAGLSALTYTLIQAPSNGWTSTTTILTGALAACLLVAFVGPADPPRATRSSTCAYSPIRGSPRRSAGVMALFFALTPHLPADPDLPVRARLLPAGRRPARPTAGAVVAIAAPLGAKIAGAKGPRLPITAGLMLATGGLCLFATATGRRVPALHDRDDVRRSRDRTLDGARDPLDHELRPARQGGRRLRDQRHHPQPRRRPRHRDRRQPRRLRLQDRARAGEHPPQRAPRQASSANPSLPQPRSART